MTGASAAARRTPGARAPAALPLFAQPAPAERPAKPGPARPGFVHVSPGQHRSAQRAVRPTGLPAVHARLTVRGWDVVVFDSPYGAGLLLVHAMRGGTWLSEEVADQDAARRWVAGLPPEADPKAEP